MRPWSSRWREHASAHRHLLRGSAFLQAPAAPVPTYPTPVGTILLSASQEFPAVSHLPSRAFSPVQPHCWRAFSPFQWRCLPSSARALRSAPVPVQQVAYPFGRGAHQGCAVALHASQIHCVPAARRPHCCVSRCQPVVIPKPAVVQPTWTRMLLQQSAVADAVPLPA